MKSDNELQKLVLFGGRGGAEVTADYVGGKGAGTQVWGFLNDEFSRGTKIGRYPVLGAFSDWAKLPPNVHFNAPLHKAKEMYKRASIIGSLGIPAHRWESVVHPLASISESTRIAEGAGIGPYSVVSPNVVVGRHVALRAGSVIGHDIGIGDFVFVGANVTVCAYARIGEGVHIGPNSTVNNGVTIGQYAVIGIGSAVVKDVGDFEIVAGNPARKIGNIVGATMNVDDRL